MQHYEEEPRATHLPDAGSSSRAGERLRFDLRGDVVQFDVSDSTSFCVLGPKFCCADGAQLESSFSAEDGSSVDDGSLTSEVNGSDIGGSASATSTGLLRWEDVGSEEECVIGRRNLLLRLVIRPDPSTLMLYWSNFNTSTTDPTLSHLRGAGPL